jgi:glycosyltransferase involved in cell wall biosynthesis
LRGLLDSLVDQTLAPDEVVVSDGGSSDDTLDVLQAYQEQLPLRIVDASGSNISAGRNRAIAAATGDIIAATDAGVLLSPTWLEELTAPIRFQGATVVSGWFEPDPRTDFEVVMGATVLPDYADVDPHDFLPSSRSVAFRKSAWEAVGGYPEWLDYSEDLIFDMRLRQLYGPFPFAPGAVAYFRPRGGMRAFFRQYYLYARGDGKANLWPKRHLIRYATYLLGVPLLLRGLWRGRWWSPILLGLGVAAYTRRPAERLWPATYGWRPPLRLRAFALIPLIRLVGDVAKMIGYPAGLMWRWRHRPSAE